MAKNTPAKADLKAKNYRLLNDRAGTADGGAILSSGESCILQ